MSSEPSSRVVFADCTEEFPKITSDFQLVFADPPFNIGRNYNGYDDNRKPREYRKFTRRWIAAAWDRVAPGGVLVLHGSIKMNPVYWRAILVLNLEDHYETKVVWSYAFGQCRFTDWIDSHCEAIVLRKPGPRHFDASPVFVESARLKMGDKRVKSSKHGGMRPPGTVWGIPSDGPHFGRVTGAHSNKERWAEHDNQLPIRYMQRWVLAYTKPGDWVLDPFAGSGTTGLVAKHEGRNFLGIEISEFNAESARKRIASGFYRPIA